MLPFRVHTLRTIVIEEMTEASKLFRFLNLRAAQRGSQLQTSMGWRWGVRGSVSVINLFLLIITQHFHLSLSSLLLLENS